MENKIDTYIKKEVLIRPTKLMDELSYDNKFFNHRNEYNMIIEYVDDFLTGKTINRYLVLPELEMLANQLFFFKFMSIF